MWDLAEAKKAWSSWLKSEDKHNLFERLQRDQFHNAYYVKYLYVNATDKVLKIPILPLHLNVFARVISLSHLLKNLPFLEAKSMCIHCARDPIFFLNILVEKYNDFADVTWFRLSYRWQEWNT